MENKNIFIDEIKQIDVIDKETHEIIASIGNDGSIIQRKDALVCIGYKEGAYEARKDGKVYKLGIKR